MACLMKDCERLLGEPLALAAHDQVIQASDQKRLTLKSLRCATTQVAPCLCLLSMPCCIDSCDI